MEDIMFNTGSVPLEAINRQCRKDYRVSHNLWNAIRKLQKASSMSNQTTIDVARYQVVSSGELSQDDLNIIADFYIKRGITFRSQKNVFENISKDPFDQKVVDLFNSGDIICELKKEMQVKLTDIIKTKLENHAFYGQKALFEQTLQKAETCYPAMLAKLPRWEDKKGEASEPAPSAPLAPIPVTEHRINALSARIGVTESDCYTLYIDEAGERFDAETAHVVLGGKIVALLLPPQTELPPLPHNYHATQTKFPDLHSQLADLLKTECGIFGMAVDSMPAVTSGGWYSLLKQVICWAMRLLPLPSDATRKTGLRIFIEERADFSCTLNPMLLAAELHHQLEEETDSRASRIRLLGVGFTPKNYKYLGYVDLLCNLWGSPDENKRKLLEDCGLLGSCLHERPAEVMEACRAAMQGKLLHPEEWGLLMRQSDADQEYSLPHLALEALLRQHGGEESAVMGYVQEVSAYLASKDYDLDILARQTDWLRRAEGENASKKLQFFLRLNELAQLNHEGILGDRLEEVRAVVEDMAEAMAGIVPQIDLQVALRIASSYANQFDFKAASEKLAPWAASGSVSSELKGKLFSALAQYEAFRQEHQKAEKNFYNALKEFDNMAIIDPGLAARQSAQTKAYRAVNAIDNSGEDPVFIRQCVMQALGCSITDAICSPDILADRYRHYLLTRFLSSAGSSEERNLYCRSRNRWIEEDGENLKYPWPLIWYHRWLMLELDTKNRDKLKAQIRRCRGVSGLTVDYICLVLEIGMGITDPTSHEAKTVLAEVARLMPAASEDIRKIQEPNRSRKSIVKEVLHFNYR